MEKTNREATLALLSSVQEFNRWAGIDAFTYRSADDAVVVRALDADGLLTDEVIAVIRTADDLATYEVAI